MIGGGTPIEPASRPAGGGWPVVVYVSIIGCLGAAIIVHSLWQVARAPFDPRWLWLALLTVASSAAVLQLSTSRVAFSVAEIFTFSAVLLFGPGIGALTVAVDSGVLSLRLAMRGRPLRRSVLSVTAPTLAMWIAAQLLFALCDVAGSLREPLAATAIWLPLAASAIVYYLLDTWMIAIAIALDERTQVWRVWRDHFAQLWVSFLVGAHAAGLIVVALGDLGLSFFAFVAPIPLLLYYAMRTWVGRINEQVVHLQQMNDQSQILHEQQTLRLQTEIALRERDRQFQAVFDAALDALFLVDDARRVVSANPAACALLDVSGDHLPSSPLDHFLSPPSAEGMRADWSRMLAGGEHQGELIAATGGRERTVEFSFKAGVVPNRHLFVWRDVSDRQQLERQLQQSQKMETVGRLAGGVAHDFNNLVTVILGNAAFLVEDGCEHDGVREIIAAAERAASLTRQLLAFSRKQQLQMEVVNLNGVVSGVEKMLRRLLDESIEFTAMLDPAVWPVRADVMQMEQVIVNLVVNARDAMPDGGHLAVATANLNVGAKMLDCSGTEVIPGRYVVISVTDTGSGMDRATLAQIFEPFFTTKPHDRGTGLGLSMVYGIVRQSNGYITVESSPGVGSTFSVYLARVAQPMSADAVRVRAGAAPSGGSETILLVEDEEPLRVLARRALERFGYTVIAAASGDEACRLYGDRWPDRLAHHRRGDAANERD